ncbi:MAG: HesA/MoeB/ThiF family protein [Chloroflexota bacterium]|nr:HesA/MoeB/ThiF family protein [Chloroflexota bacterium]
MLTKAELERYQRQILIEGFDEAGQEKLKQAKVMIAGVGGLGSPIAIYLTVAGVGHIRIVDNDVVEPSNLNRQILHWDNDISKAKVQSAREKLSQLNPNITVEALQETIAEDNVLELVGDCHLIVDAMDNFPARYLLNKAALTKRIPFFYGGINGLYGMATTLIPGETGCLRCIVNEAPPPMVIPVIGVTPGIIGCIQATEVIKYIVGNGKLLKNRLLLVDGLEMTFQEVECGIDPKCPDCGCL